MAFDDAKQVPPSAYGQQQQQEQQVQQQASDIGVPQTSVWDWRIGWEVNKVWHHIINSIPHKAPYFQNSFNTEQAINTSQKWSKDYLYMGKRAWFQLHDYLAGYELTDAVELEWTIYFLAVYESDRSYVKILKLVGNNLVDIETTRSANKKLIPDWAFQFNEWLSEKFALAYFPGWEPRLLFDNSTTTIYSGTWYCNYDETNGYFLEDDTAATDSWVKFNSAILPWDYIYIYHSDFWCSGMTWVVSMVNVDATWNNKPMIRIQWAWDINLTPANPKTWPLNYIIFPQLSQTAMFSTTAWLCQIHGADIITPVGALYSTWWVNMQITSSGIFKEVMYIMDNNRWRLYYWWTGLMKNYIKPLNYIEIGKKYKRLYPFQNYLMIMWDNDIWSITQDFNSDNTFKFDMFEWISWTWVRWEWSYTTYLGWFYLVSNEKNFYSFTVVVNYLSKPQGKLEAQSYRVIDQLRTADYKRWQKCNLQIDSNGIKIFLSERTYAAGFYKINTKVLFYSYYRGFRFYWMVPNVNLNNQIRKRWFGSAAYTNEWDTDGRSIDSQWIKTDGYPIKQIFTWVFWADSPTSEKFITTTKALFWQDTKLTRENSSIRLSLTHGWRSRTINASYIDDTEFVTWLWWKQWWLAYPNAIFTWRVSWMTTDVTITAIIAGIPWNDISLIGDGTSTVQQLIVAWNTKNPTNQCLLTAWDWSQVPSIGTVIDLSTALETFPDGTDILDGNYNITDYQTFETEFANFQTYAEPPIAVTYSDPFAEQIGKFAVLERGLTQYADLLIYELIANGKDRADFWWCIVIYAFTDADNTRLDNVMSVDLH